MPFRLLSPRHLLGRVSARHRLAALAALVMLVVATPLAEVWQRQGRELELLLGASAALDPMARAVDSQRALLGHRDAARQVLRGRHELEPTRQRLQDEVDQRLAVLTVSLLGSRRSAAFDECEALRDEWLALSKRVVTRRIDAAGSDAAHRLLVEQVLQVVDLLAIHAAPPHASASADAAPWPLWQLLSRTLPRAEAAWAGDDPEAHRVAAAALSRTSSPEVDATTAPALVKARAAALAALRAATPAADGTVDRSAAQQRLMEWTAVVEAHLRSDLNIRIKTVEAQRRQQALVVLVLGALASLLWLGLWRSTLPAAARSGGPALQAPPVNDPGSAEPAAESLAPTQRAIDRARKLEAPTTAGTPPERA